MFLRAFIPAAVILASGAAWGQRFEVASVRPADPAARMGNLMQGGPGTADPGRFTGTNVMLSTLVLRAFGVKNDQLTGPDWMGSARFDVAATIPAGATKEQLNAMLQNLLAERFHLTYHAAKKEFPVYTLTVGPGGAKLKAAAAPAAPGSTRTMASCQGDRMTVKNRDAAGVTQSLESAVGARVVDQTGLTGTYDFELYFGMDRSLGNSMLNCQGVALDAPPALQAVPQQLGLKLEKSNAMLDVIVIDHLDKTPTSN